MGSNAVVLVPKDDQRLTEKNWSISMDGLDKQVVGRAWWFQWKALGGRYPERYLLYTHREAYMGSSYWGMGLDKHPGTELCSTLR